MDVSTNVADEDGGVTTASTVHHRDADDPAATAAERQVSEARTAHFFASHRPITQADADQTAARITGRAVRPLPLQGPRSYTVAAGEVAVIQFRDPLCMVDVKLWGLARQTYGPGLVPRCEPMGLLGHLHVYRAGLVPGQAFERVRRKFFGEGMENVLSRTVQDLARFYASAWRVDHTPPTLDSDRHALRTEYVRQLDDLAPGLPDRFRDKLAEVRSGLPRLFEQGYPHVLSHAGALDLSLHVDPDTGEITGLTHWADARVVPFGTSLWAVETIISMPPLLGFSSSESGHGHDDDDNFGLGRHHPAHQRLRRKFWRVLADEIGKAGGGEAEMGRVKTAWLLGLFLAFGGGNGQQRQHKDEESMSGAGSGAGDVGYGAASPSRWSPELERYLESILSTGDS